VGGERKDDPRQADGSFSRVKSFGLLSNILDTTMRTDHEDLGVLADAVRPGAAQ
jgi:hypothetical protein